MCGYGKYTYVSSLNPEALDGFPGETADQRQAREDLKQKSYFYRAFEITYSDYFASIIEENEAAESKFEKEEQEEKIRLAKVEEDKLKAGIKEKEREKEREKEKFNPSTQRSNVTEGEKEGVKEGVSGVRHVIEEENEAEKDENRRHVENNGAVENTSSHTETAAGATEAAAVDNAEHTVGEGMKMGEDKGEKEGVKEVEKEVETPLERSRRQFEDMLGIRL